MTGSCLRALRPAILGAALVSVCGCASMALPKLRAVSAGYTGCLPADNEVTNYSPHLGVTTWNASCKGKTYLCSAVGNSEDSTTVHCAPVSN